MPLPHDFRAAARLPIPANANGAPLQISGSKLQENFEYLDRKESGGSSLPDGEAGDMLYHDGTDWVPLVNPGAPTSGYKWTLQHDAAVPEWVEYKEITVSICEAGTPTEYTILGLPTA
jgi:hypothetical protein